MVALSCALYVLALGYEHVSTGTLWVPALPFILLGFSLFLRAKLSVICRGMLFSVGTARMSGIMTALYLTGYCLMIAGIVAAFG